MRNVTFQPKRRSGAAFEQLDAEQVRERVFGVEKALSSFHVLSRCLVREYCSRVFAGAEEAAVGGRRRARGRRRTGA